MKKEYNLIKEALKKILNESEKHISDMLIDHLKKDGWSVKTDSKGETIANKKMNIDKYKGGTLAPEGTRNLSITIDKAGRYVSIEAGWKSFDVDLRDYTKTEKDMKKVVNDLIAKYTEEV